MLEKFFGNKKRIADIALVASILLIALFVFVILELTKTSGQLLRVTVDGEVVGEYSLMDDGEYLLNGGTNILVIENGEAYVKWADCPKQICVNTGRISHTGQRITCLANRIVVEVIGGEKVLEV